MLFLVIGILAFWGTSIHTYEEQVAPSVGAIFIPNEAGGTKFHCSGTEIGSYQGEGYFLTARHCIANVDTAHVEKKIIVSFTDNEKGPFYEAKPLAISQRDDLALLEIVNGGDIPTVTYKSDQGLHSGSPIFNESYPLGAGKQVFHGEYMQDHFAAFPKDFLQEYPIWVDAMPMNITIAHGSSGSGIFSSREHALIGVAVGTFDEGSFNIGIPGSRVVEFIHHLPENSVSAFVQKNQEHDAENPFYGYHD